ncbi:TPA: hypothetical protein ACF1UY_001772 [Enterococcus hirae]
MLLLLLLIGLYVFRSYWCPLCKGGLYTSNFFFRYRYELMIYFLDDDVGTFVLYSNYGSYDVEKVLMNVFGNNDYVGIENEQGQVTYCRQNQIGRLQLFKNKIR